MNGCACLCAIHGTFATVKCAGSAQRTVTLIGMVAPPRMVEMCEPCARWWEESQLHSPAPEVRPDRIVSLSPRLLHQAIAKAAQARGGLSYREIAAQSGLASINVLSRIKRGHRPDLTNLARLLVWLGSTDLAPYLRYEERS